jgi:flagellar assembly factor FliW
MKVKTTRFGEVEVSQNVLFELVGPILGYEGEKEFVLIEHKANSSFKWLQSLKTPDLAFAITIPGLFGIDYTFELPDSVQEDLDIESIDELLALNIVLIPHENPRASTVNLLAPLIFNTRTKKGAQVILVGTNFKVQHPLINDAKQEEKEAVC